MQAGWNSTSALVNCDTTFSYQEYFRISTLVMFTDLYEIHNIRQRELEGPRAL